MHPISRSKTFQVWELSYQMGLTECIASVPCVPVSWCQMQYITRQALTLCQWPVKQHTFNQLLAQDPGSMLAYTLMTCSLEKFYPVISFVFVLGF